MSSAWSRRSFVLSLSLGARAGADPASERAASAYLDGIRSTPLALRRFMQELPKGADLHNHASGAVYAERLIDYAVTDGLCADAAYALAPCPAPAQNASNVQPLATSLKQNGYRDRLIDALSMRFFVQGEESGHDHFFNAFGKFGPATWKHGPEIVAEAVRQAAEDRVDYLELMTTFGNGPAWSALTQRRRVRRRLRQAARRADGERPFREGGRRSRARAANPRDAAQRRAALHAVETGRGPPRATCSCATSSR